METKLTEETRVESDLIGAREIPARGLQGGQMRYTAKAA